MADLVLHIGVATRNADSRLTGGKGQPAGREGYKLVDVLFANAGIENFYTKLWQHALPSSKN